MNKLNTFIQRTTRPLVLILLLFIAYLFFRPFKTIEIYSQPIPTDKNSYQLGEPIKYTMSFCRYTGTEARITRNLVKLKWTVFTIPVNSTLLLDDQIDWNRQFIQYFESNVNQKTFCNPDHASTLTNHIVIPEELVETSWRYTIEVNARYDVTIFQTRNVIVYFEPFYIHK